VVLDSPGTVVRDNVFAFTDSYPHGPVLISPELSEISPVVQSPTGAEGGWLSSVRAFFNRLLGR
jgi:hypothetical protein